MRPNDEIRAIFECLPPPFLAIFYAFALLFEEKLSQICIRNDKKMGSSVKCVDAYHAMHIVLM